MRAGEIADWLRTLATLVGGPDFGFQQSNESSPCLKL